MSKYKSVRINGYASKREATYAANFQALAKAGHIRDYKEQQRFFIAAGKGSVKPVIYVADFVYTDSLGRHVVDVKGYRTPVYQIKKKLLYLLHGIEIEEL